MSIEPEKNVKGLVGALCWWGAWGPGPMPPPLKSGPGHSNCNDTFNRFDTKHACDR